MSIIIIIWMCLTILRWRGSWIFLWEFLNCLCVAEKVHKNPSYISKVFKNEFDCNFSSYVTDRRLEKSKELLADPLVKVYEIAEELGWADVSNFIKVFKKKFGISPDEYRKVASGMTDSRR